MKFSDTYVRDVLRDNFEDARRLFFDALLEIHAAHLIMLVEQGILPEPEGRTLAAGLARVRDADVRAVDYDGSFEDLFFWVEAQLEAECGSEVAGRLHTARSRNDIDVTLYRLRWREEVLGLLTDLAGVRHVLLEICAREVDTVFPAHTHTQPAQPSTVAHYFLGIAESLARDHQRLTAALERMNFCPMGSCAISGTSFPISRERVSELLGFDGPTGNTYSSIAAVDYILEAVGAVQVLMNSTSRVLHDLLVWAMAEFRFVRIDDEFVQPSSIMPQKRNPVALEHARAICGKASGEASAVFQMLQNTPYGDIVDVEDDLQPIVEQVFRDAGRVLRLLAATLAGTRFERERMRSAASANWITVTQLADVLCREQSLSFRTAHVIVSRMIRLSEEEGLSPADALGRAAQQVIGRNLGYSPERLAEILDPQYFVEVRDHLGGPAPLESDRAGRLLGESLETDRRNLNQWRERFTAYRVKLDRKLQEV